MSRASEFAARYKAATETLTEAQRGRDAIAKPSFVVKVRQDHALGQAYQDPFDRMLAHVTVGGDLQLSQHQCSPGEALDLARWILETFER